MLDGRNGENRTLRMRKAGRHKRGQSRGANSSESLSAFPFFSHCCFPAPAGKPGLLLPSSHSISVPCTFQTVLHQAVTPK